jgi:hypothetical protein
VQGQSFVLVRPQNSVRMHYVFRCELVSPDSDTSDSLSPKPELAVMDVELYFELSRFLDARCIASCLISNFLSASCEAKKKNCLAKYGCVGLHCSRIGGSFFLSIKDSSLHDITTSNLAASILYNIF